MERYEVQWVGWCGVTHGAVRGAMGVVGYAGGGWNRGVG